MYKQYTTEHQTEAGTMKIERTYKIVDNKTELDSILVTVKDKILELPKSMWQTDTTIIRKVCSMVK